MSYWSQVNFQDSCSPMMNYIASVHDWIMVVVLVVVSIVFYLLLSLFFMKGWNRFLVSAEVLEFIWAGLPALSLGVLAVPSLHCLYLMEEVSSPLLSVKAIGHQWYWSYENTDWSDESYDSYMNSDSPLFRLLDVTNTLAIPLESEVRLLVTSSDVIHSWTIPSLGVKSDAIPGRLNQLILYSSKLGYFYGQCSEMCGANHSFMPIVLEVLPKSIYFELFKL
uniref:Cytochrome c oxidase subunit 2 n=1 Tax=Haematopinus asini TaxID=1461129 RepID=A0A059T416_9NEOP|nr:cytochrome c oxidase subunit II [Haematopinus asini]